MGRGGTSGGVRKAEPAGPAGPQRGPDSGSLSLFRKRKKEKRKALLASRAPNTPPPPTPLSQIRVPFIPPAN